MALARASLDKLTDTSSKDIVYFLEGKRKRKRILKKKGGRKNATEEFLFNCLRLEMMNGEQPKKDVKVYFYCYYF